MSLVLQETKQISSTAKEPSYSYYDYNDNDQLLNNRYIKIQDLNNGSYGNITLARDLSNSQLVAIKYYYSLNGNSDSDNEDEENLYPKGDIDNCLYEYNILKTLHNNITSTAKKLNTALVDSIINAVDQFDAYLVMEYCSHGDLYDAIRTEMIPRSSKMLFHLTSQLTNCLEFIHLNGVYHRDIKPENILIHDITSWQLKLTDFGLATIENTSNEKDIGSERYMAPELFLYEEDELCNLDTDNDELFSSANNNTSYEADKVDIWALGITFLNIVFHKNPFEIAKPNMDKIFKYYCYNREAILDIFDIMTPSFYKLVISCLQLNPSDRTFTTVKSLLRSCKEFTFDDYIYNTTEKTLYKDVFVEGWDENVGEIDTSSLMSPPATPSADESDYKPATSLYNPVDINTKHYETAGDVLLRQQKEVTTANSWKAKNLNKLNRNFKHKSYKNNGQSVYFTGHKFNDKHRRKNVYNNALQKNTANHNKETKNEFYYTRKPLGIPKPNKHILKYNENSPNLQYSTNTSFKSNRAHKPMSFKSTNNSYSNSFMNSYHPNYSFINKNGISNSHYNKNFNHYMKIQNNYGSNSDYSQEEDNKHFSNDDDFDLDPEIKSESFEKNQATGKFQTAHEYMKVQQSLKNLSESRKNAYKTKYLSQAANNNESLSQNDDDDVLFTLEEDLFGMDDSNGTIDTYPADSYANSNKSNGLKPSLSSLQDDVESSFDDDELPELLKSPVSSYQGQHSIAEVGNSKKNKSLYVSPANRRHSSSLSGSIGMFSNNRRKSHSAGNNIDQSNIVRNTRNIKSSVEPSQFRKFHRPSFINSLTAKPTLSVSKKHIDVFSDTEESEANIENDPSIVPFSQRMGRKSVADEIVNMEDYKKNWLSLQLEDEI